MIQLTQKSKGAIDNRSINSINKITNNTLTANDMVMGRINNNTIKENQNVVQEQQKKSIPQLMNRIAKGQKIPITFSGSSILDVCMGWNVKNPNCDIDVSAFLLDKTGKVIGDDWFVFYGQPDSPDKSVIFSEQSLQEREEISIDISRLNPSVGKIVFVLTVNEALQKNLNFSMICDAYIRILEHSSRREIVSFKIEDYYANIVSMMIGELYIHNGTWKFNAIGNGVAKDLEGLCKLYGVETV